MSFDMAQFHQVFFEESFEGLDIMETGLLNMDPGTVDAEEINAIFRAAHSIKGGSGTFGFMHASEFTHVIETLLDEMRDGRRQVTTDAVNVLLQSVDVLRDMLTAARNSSEPDEKRVKAQRADLERILADRASPVEGQASSEPTETPADIAQGLEPAGWNIVFRPHRHLTRTGNDPLRIIRELASIAHLTAECDTSELPSLEDLEPEDMYLSWSLRLHGAVDKAQIYDVFEWVEDDSDFAVLPLLPEGATPAIGSRDPFVDKAVEEDINSRLQVAPPPVERRETNDRRKLQERRKVVSTPSATSSSIRVDISKIDSLINMVGELVITQSMLGMLGDDFQMSRLERLKEGLAQLERQTRELQESVMRIRMVPISFSFSRFPRLVHDLSHKLRKKIELKISGESIEVDKTVIEKIGDPLVHLVRNSLDHGIESPEERVAAGKAETGTVFLSASHRGGNIVIEIRDDGRGLPRDRILNKAIERGLVKPDENLTDKEVYDLIFQPGFSTAEQVSDVSGRGVGMDVVRRNINELGGAIEIESTPGHGSAIIVRLPLT